MTNELQMIGEYLRGTRDWHTLHGNTDKASFVSAMICDIGARMPTDIIRNEWHNVCAPRRHSQEA